MNLKKAKWIVPVLATLVILESILIVRKISVKTTGGLGEKTGEAPVSVFPEEEKSVTISLVGEEEIAVGSENEIKVAMTTLESLNLDGVDVLISYDPEYLEIVGIDPSDKFSYLARNWIQPEKKRVLVSMVETDEPEGVFFESGGETTLLLIEYIPLRPGKTTLEIVGGEGGAGTVLAENGTAQKIPFNKEGLEIAIE